MTEPLLQVRGLTRRFGGILANDGIDLDLQAGEVHAVIGANGAGKSTLIGQLGGEIAPDHGSIRLRGRDVTHLPPHRRARLGLARTYQTVSLLPAFTVAENVAFALVARDGQAFRFWRPAAGDRRLADEARTVLGRVGLAGDADRRAGTLNHGAQRQLEIAMAIATRPRLLLCDEPMAGLGLGETDGVIGLLRDLGREIGLLLVEHDMQAVFALAQRITVLDRGRVVATGAPEAIRANADVQRLYLGAEA